MDDTKKMLRAIINGQSALKQELLGEIRKVRNDVSSHREETKEGFTQVIKRVGISSVHDDHDLPLRHFVKPERIKAPISSQ